LRSRRALATNRVTLISFVAALASFAATSAFTQSQVVDLDYDTTIALPAYAARHPAVLFDEAHHGLRTAGGLYEPFADLITHDGYRVEGDQHPRGQVEEINCQLVEEGGQFPVL
jgi:hypothetical protein